MKKRGSYIFISLWLMTASLYGQRGDNYSKYVNPFIGTAYHGHTFPGACLPFGMIQAGPETGNASWRYCSGYNYEDDFVTGFSQTRLNGTGVPELGDILLLPLDAGQKETALSSKMDKNTEKASPGYYAVHLPDSDIRVEITATEHVAYHRYTFKKGGAARLLVDLQSGLVHRPEVLPTRVHYSHTDMPDNRTITGNQEVQEWVRRHFSYVIRFNRSYVVEKWLPMKPEEKGKRTVLRFNELKPGETLEVKVAISTVDVNGANASLVKEIPGWNFDQVRANARDKWNKIFAKVNIKGNENQKINFYTALYHLFIQPSNIADTDGRYRGPDDKIYQSPNKTYYSTLSLWDTYRAAHPLYTILAPEKVDGFVETMIRHHKVAGFLPIWTLWGKENYCMIGNHAIPVIADAYLKGFRGFDTVDAYAAVKQSATVSHFNSDWETYDRFGYYPFDIVERESVSRTLESAYDDYCIAKMAERMGKKEDVTFFTKRAGYYKNLIDPETGLMRGKDSNGNWRTPFDPFSLSHFIAFGGDYTEGNAWQYSWHVQQDIPGLIEQMGGKKVFSARLDTLFTVAAPTEPNLPDVTGLIGQYAHGNEPSHHVAYLYNYVGKNYRTQELVREITDRFYQPRPDGLCGNDDCGQMSAWYIFTAMGFYPVDPVSGEYIIGAPQIKEITLSLPGGKKFRIKASNLSVKNKYIKSIELNGQPLQGFRIAHEDIVNGGVLKFKMKDKP